MLAVLTLNYGFLESADSLDNRSQAFVSQTVTVSNPSPLLGQQSLPTLSDSDLTTISSTCTATGGTWETFADSCAEPTKPKSQTSCAPSKSPTFAIADQPNAGMATPASTTPPSHTLNSTFLIYNLYFYTTPGQPRPAHEIQPHFFLDTVYV